MDTAAAVLENGDIKCWGYNFYGQLGTGNRTDLNVPSEAINLGGKATAISLGTWHSCAVLENGEVKCWGNNSTGRLGTGDHTDLNTPSTPINLGGKAIAISLGDEHSCAVLENGQVKCWGYNLYGQLGIGNNTTILGIPSAPIELRGKAKAIYLGRDHSCAVLENGQVKCWGFNFRGQLKKGYGNTVNTNTPIQSY